MEINNENMKLDERELYARLPLSQEVIKIDANARAFYHCLLRGDDPYAVIDQMLVHYTGVKNDLFEKLLKIQKTSDFINGGRSNFNSQSPDTIK